MIYDNATDSSYAFGGYGVENGATYILNHVWNYSIPLGTWTFLSGNRSNPNDRGNYGTKTVTSSTNRLSSRLRHMCVLDPQLREVWIFGVSLDANSASGVLNDWWKYSLANATWTWMGGTQNPLTNSSFLAYGKRGVESALNIPPRRTSVSVAYEPIRKQAFMYGGSSYGLFPYSDLWRFDLRNNSWTWLDGSQNEGFVRPVFTSPGNSSSVNAAGSRQRGSAFFNAATFTLYGGMSNENGSFANVYSDFWAYELPCPSYPNNYTCIPGVCLLVNGASSSISELCSFWIISSGGHWFY
eukprot:TRINITY_DN11739_c0_g1_i1.p1 TRINITY_DN11739_c0_g1~~TRINITY_DN11739_c0_g1_i1.p1  ORF type:complete len:298 (+),score=25.53 TRINITY_DN11739_c0_g1_i1:120-1013(+)